MVEFSNFSCCGGLTICTIILTAGIWRRWTVCTVPSQNLNFTSCDFKIFNSSNGDVVDPAQSSKTIRFSYFLKALIP